MICGTCTALNRAFPKAETLLLPEPEAILSFTTVTSAGTAIPLTPESQANLKELLLTAQPTRRMSVHDAPAVRPYTQIDITDAQRHDRIYVYEEDAQVYAELPYTGVYRAAPELLDLLTP